MAGVSYLITGGLGNFTPGTGGELTATEIANAVWDTVATNHLTAGSTGAALSNRATQVSLDEVAAAVEDAAVSVAQIETSVLAVQAKTDGLTFTVPGDLDVNVKRWRDTLAAVEDMVGYPKVTIKDGTGQGEILTTAGVIDSITAVTNPTGFSLSAAGVDAILDEVIEGAITLRESIRLANAANAGKLSGAATTEVAIRDIDDTKNRITATVDADGNRLAVTRDLS